LLDWICIGQIVEYLAFEYNLMAVAGCWMFELAYCGWNFSTYTNEQLLVAGYWIAGFPSLPPCVK
jgi:hypothetical protein